MAGWLKQAWLWLNDEETAALPSRVDISITDLSDWILDQQQAVSKEHQLEQELQQLLSQLKQKRGALEGYRIILEDDVPTTSNQDQTLIIEKLEHLSAAMLFPEHVSLRKAIMLSIELEQQLDALLTLLKESDFLPDHAVVLSQNDADAHYSPPAAQMHPLVNLVLELHAYAQRFCRAVDGSRFQNFESLLQQAQQLHDLAQQHKNLRGSVSIFQERLKGAESRWEHKKAELGLLEEDPHYASWRQLTHQRTQVQAQLELTEDRLYRFFTSLRPLLELYAQKVEPTAVVRRYLGAPFDTLLEDEEFQLETLLLLLKDALLAEKIIFPREQVFAYLALLEPGKINLVRELRLESLQLREQRKQLDDSLQHKNFLIKVDDAKYRLDHFSRQVRKWQEELQALEREEAVKGKELTHLLSVLQEKLRTAIGRDVTITG